jgi:hypothetical protein
LLRKRGNTDRESGRQNCSKKRYEEGRMKPFLGVGLRSSEKRKTEIVRGRSETRKKELFKNEA